MKLKQLVKRVSEFADSDLQERKKKDRELKKTLKKLKKKGLELEKKLQAEVDPIEREKIENKLKIVKAQRKKGVELRKEIKTNLTKN
mgnify:CR=1 FL=1